MTFNLKNESYVWVTKRNNGHNSYFVFKLLILVFFLNKKRVDKQCLFLKRKIMFVSLKKGHNPYLKLICFYPGWHVWLVLTQWTRFWSKMITFLPEMVWNSFFTSIDTVWPVLTQWASFFWKKVVDSRKYIFEFYTFS